MMEQTHTSLKVWIKYPLAQDWFKKDSKSEFGKKH